MIDLRITILAVLLLPASRAMAQQEPEEPGEATRPLYAISGPTERLKFNRTPMATIAMRREETVTRSPSSVTVIPGTDLRERFGVRTVSDALRIVPGLEVIRTTSTESIVNARGYNDVPSSSAGMMALVDGRQVNNEFLGAVLWDFLPVTLDSVDRVEIIRGPGSFLYGPNAMHGLINIVTRSPLDYERNFLQLSGGYGSYESSTASLMVVRRTEDTGFKATFGWDDMLQFEEDPFQRVGNKRFVEFRFEKEVGEDHRIDVAGGNIEQTQELLIPSVLVVPPAEVLNDLNESYVKGNYSLGDLRAQVSWAGMDATSTPDEVYTGFELDLDTVDLDLQYSIQPGGGHHVTVGSGYRHASFRTENQDIAVGRHATDLEWAFIQDEVQVVRDLFVTAGLRLDRHSVTGTSPSPRIAAVWRMDEEGEQSLRASAGYGFRNPSLRELWFDMPVTIPGPPPATVTIVGNEDLEAEKIRSFEVGYSGAVIDRIKAGAGVYYNLIDDEIAFEPAGPTSATPANQNDQEAYGIELEMDYLFSETISGFVNYSHGIRRDRETRDRVRRAPKNKGNAGVRVSTSEGIIGMLWVSYFDETEFAGAAIDDYTLLNGQISYAFAVDETETRVYVKALNLLDEDHREHPEAQRYGLVLMAGFSLLW